MACNRIILFMLFAGIAVIRYGVYAQQADTIAKDVFSMELEELMSTKVKIATKSEQPISESPSPVSVITI